MENSGKCKEMQENTELDKLKLPIESAQGEL
jgi:hypothetical protein